MAWEAWTTIGLIGVMAVGLSRQWASPDHIFLLGMTILMTLGAIPGSLFPSVDQMKEGFSNQGVLTIGAMFVVAEGLSATGAIFLLANPLMGGASTVRRAQTRMMLPVAGLSAFLNNTPIVAMFMPVVHDLCKKYHLSPSKLFIPLSYAAIMGGTCSLIGTATNMAIYGKVEIAQRAGLIQGDLGIGMFTVAWLGVPVTVVGLIYILCTSGYLLRGRRAPSEDFAETKNYTVEMLVLADGPLVGKTVQRAGLRNLPGLYLIEIQRSSHEMTTAKPDSVLLGGDRLIFAGVVESIVDLQKIRGLLPASTQVFNLDEPRPDRVHVEAVVGVQCPLVGQTIKDGQFRSVYNAVVIAVHRNGRQLEKKIGSIVIGAGDCLLIETHRQFVERERRRQHFFLVSAVKDSALINHEKAWTAIGVMLFLIALLTSKSWTGISTVNAAFIGAGMMMILGCCKSSQARSAIQWRVLLTIAGAFGVGQALETTGAAAGLAQWLVEGLSFAGERSVLLGLCVVMLGFTSLIGPLPTAVMIFPVAVGAALKLEANAMPFVMAVMLCPALALVTPTAYQTNLMVYGPGGYRFNDFVRFGLPLALINIGVIVWLAPWIWPF